MKLPKLFKTAEEKAKLIELKKKNEEEIRVSKCIRTLEELYNYYIGIYEYEEMTGASAGFITIALEYETRKVLIEKEDDWMSPKDINKNTKSFVKDYGIETLERVIETLVYRKRRDLREGIEKIHRYVIPFKEIERIPRILKRANCEEIITNALSAIEILPSEYRFDKQRNEVVGPFINELEQQIEEMKKYLTILDLGKTLELAAQAVKTYPCYTTRLDKLVWSAKECGGFEGVKIAYKFISTLGADCFSIFINAYTEIVNLNQNEEDNIEILKSDKVREIFVIKKQLSALEAVLEKKHHKLALATIDLICENYYQFKQSGNSHPLQETSTELKNAPQIVKDCLELGTIDELLRAYQSIRTLGKVDPKKAERLFSELPQYFKQKIKQAELDQAVNLFMLNDYYIMEHYLKWHKLMGNEDITCLLNKVKKTPVPKEVIKKALINVSEEFYQKLGSEMFFRFVDFYLKVQETSLLYKSPETVRTLLEYRGK